MQSEIDIIFLNEHWLDKDEINSFFVQGYFLANAFARKQKKKTQGGSLIFSQGISSTLH